MILGQLDVGYLDIKVTVSSFRFPTTPPGSALALTRVEITIIREKHDDVKGVPLTFPYVFPLLGSLPVACLWNPIAFVLD